MRKNQIQTRNFGRNQIASSAALRAARRKGQVHCKMRLTQTRTIGSSYNTHFIAIFIGIVLVAFTPSARAQFGSAAATTQTQATQLPLSGRNGQNGSVAAVTAPVPGTTTSVNTLNTTVQTTGPYSGSTSGTAGTAFTGMLSLKEALQRGLLYNLGTVGLTQIVRQSRAQSKAARSSLLPNLNGDIAENVQTTDL
jgi:hypothetical protein